MIALKTGNYQVNAEYSVHIALKIRQNADRHFALINKSIKLSELDHGQLQSRFEPIDLHDIARECGEQMRWLAQRKNVVLQCHGIATSMTADRALIRELLDNLIQNAVTYNVDVETRIVVRF